MNTARNLTALLDQQPHGIAALEAMVGAPLPSIDSLQVIGSNLAETAVEEPDRPGYGYDLDDEEIDEDDYLDATPMPDLYDDLYGNDCQVAR